ncbi:hypothetical protein BJ912DRAFT_697452 [Pholiota molesta]|nr:hypothetical protein BJ912DRAFT_697452 [Pholiota molesta]
MRPAVGPSSPPTKEVIPASPSPPPSNSTGLVPPTTLTVPATPATRLLGDLDAMSPLTPLPDTPLPPPRSITDSGVDDRYSDGAGWIIAPMKELTTSQPAKPQPMIAPSTSQSRLPRLSIAPSSVPHPDISQPQPSAMGPPPLLPAIKKSAIPTVGIKPSASGSKVSKDAFSLMMNKAKLDHAKLEEQRAKPGQVTDKGKKPMRQPPLFTPGPSKLKQQKAKQKMRPREKPESNKPLVIAPLPDEDEDEGESRWGSKFVPD